MNRPWLASRPTEEEGPPGSRWDPQDLHSSLGSSTPRGELGLFFQELLLFGEKGRKKIKLLSPNDLICRRPLGIPGLPLVSCKRRVFILPSSVLDKEAAATAAGAEISPL